MSWETENHQFLTRSLARIRGALEAHAERVDQEGTAGGGHHEVHSPPWPVAEPPRLRSLSDAFDLSSFELDVVLLCAAMELDSSFGSLCARACGDPGAPFPTFSLALAALAEPHWDALAPSAPLRWWDLVEAEPGPVLTQARLRVPARVWQFLLGIDAFDERLTRYVSPADEVMMSPSQDQLALRAASTATRSDEPSQDPLLQLCGRSRGGLSAVAGRCAEHLGLGLLRIPMEALPSSVDDVEQLARALRRESVLRPFALHLDCFDGDGSDVARASVLRLVSSYRGLILVTSRERRTWGARRAINFELDSPTFREQRLGWIEALSGLFEASARPHLSWVEPAADALAGQFDLDFDTLHAAALRAAAGVGVTSDAEPAAWLTASWEACRAEARPELDDLARRIDAKVDWEDLVLPAAQLRVLHDVEIFVKRRALVDAWWGLDARTARGGGTSVLFAGPSGTGKTLAAEVLAHRLRLDLYRIDLSAVVSKYIGETEKNLRRLFDAADHGGAVLLFDEADALFGKRSEVKDSHDRHANIEVGYLLQRLEAFRGLAILTTNLKSSIDQAFLRRLRFIVDFPFPDEAQRAVMWRRVFPPGVPTSDLDHARLARLNVSGASIRNIAIHASYLAADESAERGCVRPTHLLAAARREYEKLQQPLTLLETKGWE